MSEYYDSGSGSGCCCAVALVVDNYIKLNYPFYETYAWAHIIKMQKNFPPNFKSREEFETWQRKTFPARLQKAREMEIHEQTASVVKCDETIVEFCAFSIAKFFDYMPTPEEFSKVIEIAFLASLEQDEGRFFSFLLSYCPHERRKEVVQKFRHPLPFTQKNLSKLAPALLHTRQAIHFEFIDGNAFITGFGAAFKESVTMESIRPGTLSIKIERSSGSTFRIGYLTKTRLFRLPSIGLIPIKKLGLLQEEDGGDRFLGSHFSFICEILRRIYAYQRGAILIFVAGDSWVESVSNENLFGLEKATNFPGLSKSILEGDFETAKSIGYANDIASLSRIDGATIMDMEFNVLAFGAKLKTINSSDLIERYIPVDPGYVLGKSLEERPISELGGMRHRSSAQFAMDQKASMVFTVSEDGPISWQFWDAASKSVVVIKNAEAFIL